MTFHVVVTENAKANLRHYYERAAKNAPLTAGRWLNRFEDALKTLATNPQRCSIAPESDAVEPEVRQLVFGRGTGAYRALFTIAEMFLDEMASSRHPTTFSFRHLSTASTSLFATRRPHAKLHPLDRLRHPRFAASRSGQGVRLCLACR